nr:MAG TPA: hypothetical protein [Bacteriophage sp.]
MIQRIFQTYIIKEFLTEKIVITKVIYTVKIDV